MLNDNYKSREQLIKELAELRAYWVPDAEQVVEEAEQRGLLGDDD